MRDLLSSITRLPLSQQLALAASGCCLVATLTLVVLAAQSNRYTQQNLQAEFGQSMAEHLADRLGNELATGDMPLIRNREVDRVEEWVAEAVDAGAEVVCGGKRLSASCYAPTVLLNPPETCRVSSQEIFGPVISVYDKKSLNDAIVQANSLPFAFQASVFSNDYTEIMDAVNRIDGSAIMVNEHSAFRVDWMPFAGRKRSGLGVGGISHTLEEMSQSKMAVFSSR